MELSQQIIDIIHANFTTANQQLVKDELLSLELKHVMADSEYNLNNTRLSILFLSKQDINEVVKLTARAKEDFRDVIYWATLDINYPSG